MIEQIFFLLILITIGTILTQSYNISLGYTGIFHLGHIGFYAIGAYTAGILSTTFQTSFLMNILLAFLFAGFAGFLIALPAIRLKSHYLALATLGFGEIIRIILLNWVSLTGGPLGITSIPAPKILGVTFDGNFEKLVLYAGIAIVIHSIIYKIVKSPYGKILESIREDEIAAESLGKNVNKIKLQALTLSAGFAGIAGALYAHGLYYIDPAIFTIHVMIFVLVMTITGGIGNFWGAIVGPFVIYGIFEPLRFFGSTGTILGVDINIGALRIALYAAIFVIIIILRPQGIIGIRKLTKK
ncbi:MAG: branched-chain amino acid ABC transporter permease [Patescibacteria group bacterium]